MLTKSTLLNRSRLAALTLWGMLIFVAVLTPSSRSLVLAGAIPDAPTPLAPEYGAVITPVEFPPVGIPEVEWYSDPDFGATMYRVQFSSDIAFTTTPINITTPNTTYTPIALSVFTDSIWYWRVRIESSPNGASGYSDSMAFTTTRCSTVQSMIRVGEVWWSTETLCERLRICRVSSPNN